MNENKQKVGGMVRQLKEKAGLKKLGKQRISGNTESPGEVVDLKVVVVPVFLVL